MARARNIKPGFFCNDELAELPFSTRLLFIGLWTVADKAGRIEDRPKKIKMAIFPADDVDCDAGLNALQAGGFIRRYVSKGIRCIQILNWAKHQNPHPKEADSTLPAFEEVATEIPRQEPEEPEQASEMPEQARLIPSSLIPDSGSLIPEEQHLSAAPAVRRVDDVKLIFDHWRIVMGHPQAKLGDVGSKRYRAVAGRLKDGYTAEQLKSAIDGCKKSPHHMGQNDRGEVYDDLELICRDQAHVDKFLALGTGMRVPIANGAHSATRIGQQDYAAGWGK